MADIKCQDGRAPVIQGRQGGAEGYEKERDSVRRDV